MKKEDLKQVYGTPSKEFHERVVQTYNSYCGGHHGESRHMG